MNTVVCCEPCASERGEDVPATYDPWGDPWPLCANCRVAAEETAWEQWCEDYYGGDGPVTMRERYQQDAAEQRRMR